jgi:hypothetical protein
MFDGGTTYGGKGGAPFQDPDAVTARGPITKVVVRHGSGIDNLRLVYGSDGIGQAHGGHGGKEVTWSVPPGEHIVRVEGRAGDRVDCLQFFTDQGSTSPLFGGKGGNPFAANSQDGGELRTIGGRSGDRLDQITLHFGLPYFIKDITYDAGILNKPGSAVSSSPQQLARLEVVNNSSVAQSITYSKSVAVATQKTFDFQAGQSLTSTQSFEIALPEVTGVKLSLSQTVYFKEGKTTSDTTADQRSWNVPVTVPPRKKVVVTTTALRRKIDVPFSYTIAWYRGTQDNIVKSQTFSGTYKGVDVTDIHHDFQESPA